MYPWSQILQKDRARTTISILEMKEQSLGRGDTTAKGHTASEQHNQDLTQVTLSLHSSFFLLYIAIMMQTLFKVQKTETNENVIIEAYSVQGLALQS